MGVDAEMLVRIQGRDFWLDETATQRLGYEIASSAGIGAFMIVRPGEFSFWPEGRRALEIVEPFVDEYDEFPELVGKIAITQDGPPLVANEGEQFVRVHLRGRYYGPGYERGDWPTLSAIARWLYLRIPKGVVWYGGDSSGMVMEMLSPAKIDEITEHWATHGRRPYMRGFPNMHGLTDPDCAFCNAPMKDCGGGGDFTFYWCDGCGQKASLHKDGRLVLAESRHHDYPIFDNTGQPVQREGERTNAD